MRTSRAPSPTSATPATSTPSATATPSPTAVWCSAALSHLPSSIPGWWSGLWGAGSEFKIFLVSRNSLKDYIFEIVSRKNVPGELKIFRSDNFVVMRICSFENYVDKKAFLSGESWKRSLFDKERSEVRSET